MGVFRGKWVIDDVKPLFEEHGINIDYSIRGEYQEVKKYVKKDLFSKIKRLPTTIPNLIKHKLKMANIEKMNKHYLKTGKWR